MQSGAGVLSCLRKQAEKFMERANHNETLILTLALTLNLIPFLREH